MKKSMFKRVFVPILIFFLCLLLLGGSMFGIMPGSSSPNNNVSSIDPIAEPETGSKDYEKAAVSVDLYRLDADTQQKIGLYTPAWERLCVALNGAEPSFTFGSSEEKGVLMEAVATLPHAALFSISGSDLTVDIQYHENYKEECDLIRSVAESILRENVYADANSLETAVLLYTYLTTNVELADNSTVYGVLNAYHGDAIALARTLSFLLTQFDIPCGVISGDSSAFLAAEINGQYWYFAPAEEINTDHLRGLSYFCMNQERAASLFGEFVAPDWEDLSGESADTSMAGVFTDCTDWRLDLEGHYLYLAYNGSGDFTASVATEGMQKTYG